MTQVREDMNKVAIRIIEEWALMLVERVDSLGEEFDPQEDFYVGKLEFRGIVSGTYAVVCQSSFCKALASNLLGMEGEPDEGQMQDAVREMINVLSGNLLTSSYGEDAVFDLTSPVAEICGYSEVEPVLQKFALFYHADEFPIAVAFIPERVEA